MLTTKWRTWPPFLLSSWSFKSGSELGFWPCAVWQAFVIQLACKVGRSAKGCLNEDNWINGEKKGKTVWRLSDSRKEACKHFLSAMSPTIVPRHGWIWSHRAATQLICFSWIFFLDSFPGDPHLFYMLPWGQMGLCSPGGDQGLVGGKDSRGKPWKTETVHNWMPQGGLRLNK